MHGSETQMLASKWKDRFWRVYSSVMQKNKIGEMGFSMEGKPKWGVEFKP